MKKLIWLGCFMSLFYCTAAAQVMGSTAEVSLEIRNILESFAPGKAAQVGEQHLHHPDLLIAFYSNRQFEPVWVNDGKWHESASDLLAQIEESKYDGLLPASYHLSSIKEVISRDKQQSIDNGHPVHQAYVDLLLADAYFSLANDLYLGKVVQKGLQNSWEITPKRVKVDFGEAMEKGLESGDVSKSLEDFWPRYKVYRSMRKSIKEFYEMDDSLEEKWEKVGGKTLKVNEENKSVPAIRERLFYWNDLPTYSVPNEELYDSTMLAGVVHFQKRNGLDADGVIGKDTYSALNASPADMIKKIAVNMERMRWLPDTVLDGRFVMVNIANFQLDYLQDNGLDTVFTSKVIVGKEYHTTPVFNGEMAYIVLSPTWTVPSSIIKREMIPKIKKDASYLTKNHLKILTYSGKEVSPTSIDWSKAASGNFPYMIRQSPGPSNSLGQAKFIFPNKHNVYIHDTPSKSLFSKDLRAFSHGCIRIQQPAEFAEILLEGDSKWDMQRIREAMNKGKETTVMLKEKVPVVLIYLTFWADPSGKAHIRKDIYERDDAVAKALLN
ncbi:L,D-transpeptidase family protein [Echinicola rosea]|nr:L,D-transpeptidase family protein [Echinicola rosea]